jgi:hypothetical protein
VQRSFYDLTTGQFFGKCIQEYVRHFITHLKHWNVTEFLANFELRWKSQNDETLKTLTFQPLILGMSSLMICSLAFCVPESVCEAEPGRLRVLLQHVHANAVGFSPVAD